MNACVIISTVLVITSCVTLHRTDIFNIKSKSRVELKPILISCSLSDIVVISAPIIQNALYYLYKPNGDSIKLNLSRPRYESDPAIINNEYDNIVVQHKTHYSGILPVNNFRVFSLRDDSEKSFETSTKDLKANDFVIGPLMNEDHGNWVLSAFYEDIDGDWIETFQVITIEITEYIPPDPRMAHIKQGENFEFSFAYPVKNLSSCELQAPKSTFDRFYERNHVDMDTCGYIIRNLTTKDRGFWRITGVGSIVYATQIYLEVIEPRRKNG